MIAVIMAGGSGTRFWPLSRESRPKQYLKVFGEKSLLQMTVDRLSGRIEIDDIYVVTSAAQAELVQSELPGMKKSRIIVEPYGRNTAPCIALSAAHLFVMEERSADEVMLVLPADHRIGDVMKFLESLEVGLAASKAGNLVTFGIKPDHPATGYGYIEMGEAAGDGMFHVKQFREKPPKDVAQSYLDSGRFLWNSGMFMWRLDVIRDALLKYDVVTPDWFEPTADLDENYRVVKPQPIDIAVMEKADRRVVIPVDYDWSDVGSWRALHEVLDRDAQGMSGSTDTIVIDSADCHVSAKKLVALIGVRNLVIVDTPDALLVADKNDTEQVKKIVEILRGKGEARLL
jgi:mannose-1-phosphate guanylyltransferase